MKKYSKIKIRIAITSVLVIVTLFTSALLAAGSFNGQSQAGSKSAAPTATPTWVWYPSPTPIMATLAPTPTPRPLPVTDGAELDPAFGVGGIVTTDFGDVWAGGRAVALQADGKIVVAGEDAGGAYSAFYFALARFNRDGSLDTSFGRDGKVITDFDGQDHARSVVIQADGKIVVAGYGLSTGSFLMARYNSDGSLDTGFGSGGKVTTYFGAGDYTSVALQKDGKFVAMGGSYSVHSGRDFVLARYNSDGSPDTSFGDGGKVTTDFGGDDFGTSLALQADGKIVAAGYSAKIFGGTYPPPDFAPEDFALARYNSDGSLDTSFGAGGKVTTDFGSREFGYSVALQSDGKIVIAGIDLKNFSPDFELARYNPDGSLDTGFGAGGKVITDIYGQDYAYSVVMQPGGKIMAVGFSCANSPDTGSYFALVRYNSNGSLDPSFGVGGKATTSFTGDDAGEAAAVQPDGKIVVAGGAGFAFGLARYVALAPLSAQNLNIFIPLIRR